MASSVKNDTQNKDDKTQAKERAKQIEKMLEDRDTPIIIKWLYKYRKLITISAIAIFVIGIAIAVIFGIKSANQTTIASEYIGAYEVLKDLEAEQIIDMEEAKLGELKTALQKVIKIGDQKIFKSYEYRLASYYLGIIEYSQKNFEGDTGSIGYFEKAAKNTSYPFADYAYFNIGKSLEQLAFLQQDPEEYLREAIKHYSKMKNKFPNSFLSLRAKYQIGKIYEELKEYDKAKEIYAQIQETKTYKDAKEKNPNTDPMQASQPQDISETQNFVDHVDNALLRLQILSKINPENDEEEDSTKNNEQNDESNNSETSE